MKAIEILPGSSPHLAEMPDSIEGIGQLMGGELTWLNLKDIDLLAVCRKDGRKLNMQPCGAFAVKPYQDNILCGPVYVLRPCCGGFVSARCFDLEMVRMTWKPVICNG